MAPKKVLYYLPSITLPFTVNKKYNKTKTTLANKHIKGDSYFRTSLYGIKNTKALRMIGSYHIDIPDPKKETPWKFIERIAKEMFGLKDWSTTPNRPIDCFKMINGKKFPVEIKKVENLHGQPPRVVTTSDKQINALRTKSDVTGCYLIISVEKHLGEKVNNKIVLTPLITIWILDANEAELYPHKTTGYNWYKGKFKATQIDDKIATKKRKRLFNDI